MKLFVALMIAPMLVFASAKTSTKASAPKKSWFDSTSSKSTTTSSPASTSSGTNTMSAIFSKKEMSQKTAFISTDVVALANQKAQLGVEVFQASHWSAGLSVLVQSEKVKETVNGGKMDVTKNSAAYGLGGTYYWYPTTSSLNYFGGAQLLFVNDSTPTKTDNKTATGLKLGAMIRPTEAIALTAGLSANNAKEDFKTDGMLGVAFLF